MAALKTSPKQQHFISDVIDANKSKSQMMRFQLLSIIFIQYLTLMFSIIISYIPLIELIKI